MLCPTQRKQIKDETLTQTSLQTQAQQLEKKLEKKLTKRFEQQLDKLVKQRTFALEQEIKRRQQIEQQLLHDAHHDPLTGLPNRLKFIDRLTQACKHLRRHPKTGFVLLFIDLDRFKLINDTLGHLEGDRFLIQTAARLQTCLRDNDTLARLGGDEFVILLDHLDQEKHIKEICQRILTTLAQPFMLGHQPFHTSASIGAALSQPQDNVESLLKRADQAMYQAKKQGRGCLVIANNLVNLYQESELSIAFQQALEQQQIELQYLPIYSFDHLQLDHHHLDDKQLDEEQLKQADADITALEVRPVWRHPQLGKIHQQRLITIAEQADRARQLDLYVLTQLALKLTQVKQKTQAALPQTKPIEHYHYQLSSSHGGHQQYMHQLKHSLMPLKACGLELTLFFHEQEVEKAMEAHLSLFNLLCKNEFKVGLHHYGTHETSLSRLCFMPIQALKLDPSFALHLANPQYQKLIQAIQATANALALPLFATGIQNAAQQQALSQLGVQFGQGLNLGASLDHPPAI